MGFCGGVFGRFEVPADASEFRREYWRRRRREDERRRFSREVLAFVGRD